MSSTSRIDKKQHDLVITVNSLGVRSSGEQRMKGCRAAAAIGPIVLRQEEQLEHFWLSWPMIFLSGFLCMFDDRAIARGKRSIMSICYIWHFNLPIPSVVSAARADCRMSPTVGACRVQAIDHGIPSERPMLALSVEDIVKNAVAKFREMMVVEE